FRYPTRPLDSRLAVQKRLVEESSEHFAASERPYEPCRNRLDAICCPDSGTIRRFEWPPCPHSPCDPRNTTCPCARTSSHPPKLIRGADFCRLRGVWLRSETVSASRDTAVHLP